MKIRTAEINDLSEIVLMQLSMALETESIKLNEETLSKGITAILKDKNKGQYFLVEKSSRIIACFMITYEWSDWRNGEWLWMQSVYVKNEFRNLGVFNKMMSFLKEMASSNSQICGIRLYVDKTNHNAINVYTKTKMNNQHYEMFEWNKP